MKKTRKNRHRCQIDKDLSQDKSKVDKKMELLEFEKQKYTKKFQKLST